MQQRPFGAAAAYTDVDFPNCKHPVSSRKEGVGYQSAFSAARRLSHAPTLHRGPTSRRDGGWPKIHRPVEGLVRRFAASRAQPDWDPFFDIGLRVAQDVPRLPDPWILAKFASYPITDAAYAVSSARGARLQRNAHSAVRAPPYFSCFKLKVRAFLKGGGSQS
jgi:hypothetical protein